MLQTAYVFVVVLCEEVGVLARVSARHKRATEMTNSYVVLDRVVKKLLQDVRTSGGWAGPDEMSLREIGWVRCEYRPVVASAGSTIWKEPNLCRVALAGTHTHMHTHNHSLGANGLCSG